MLRRPALEYAIWKLDSSIGGNRVKAEALMEKETKRASCDWCRANSCCLGAVGWLLWLFYEVGVWLRRLCFGV